MKSKKMTANQTPVVLIASVSLCIASGARADLNQVTGMTPVQQPVAATIQEICPKMGVQASTLTAPQTLLLGSCRKLVQTSNDIQGSGLSVQSLGLSESELRGALQGVAPEEMNAQDRTRALSNASPIGARLLALRRGAGGGLLANASFNLNGSPVLLSELLPEGSQGGGASPDAGLSSPWSGFIQGHYNWGDRDASALEDAFDFDDVGITGGVDYRFSEATVAGIALSYSRTEADFDGGLGDVDSKNVGLSVYASHSIGNMYVEGVLGYSRADFDSARRILVPSATNVAGFDTTARGSTDADQFSASVGAGYDWSRDGLTLTPFARLSYMSLDIDGFTESEPVHGLGLDVEGRTVRSLQSAIGVQVMKAVSTQSGVVTPYAGIEWNHEFKNDEANIVAKYTHDPFNTTFFIPTADPDRNYFTVRAGVSATFASGLAAFANIDTVVGLNDTSGTSLTFGVRLEF